MSTQNMLIDHELSSQFLLFEDDENTEIPAQESEGDSFEDLDDEEEDDNEKDDLQEEEE